MDPSTIYIIMALSSFLVIAVVLIHHHNCSHEVRRKQGELNGVAQKLNPRIEILEQEISDLRIKIEEVDTDLTTYQE